MTFNSSSGSHCGPGVPRSQAIPPWVMGEWETWAFASLPVDPTPLSCFFLNSSWMDYFRGLVNLEFNGIPNMFQTIVKEAFDRPI